MGKRYKAKERDRLIETDRASGEPVKVVATRLGVSESTAYYWMKRARRVEPPRFARLVPTATMSKPSIRLNVGFDPAAPAGGRAEGRIVVIAHGLPVYVALEPVDMRFGYERLGGIVREKMQAEPRSRALFAFAGKRGHTLSHPLVLSTDSASKA